MAGSELPPGLSARPLQEDDLPGALALVREAGWNQVEADWRIFLALGAVVGITTADGALVATAAILPHGGRFGWISMVLVTAAQRRRGLARWLLAHCIASLEAQHLVPGLDATPAGRAVYLQLGFHDAWPLRRLVRRQDGGVVDPDPSLRDLIVRPVAASDWPALLEYDGRVFGADRGALLHRLAQRLPSAALVAERDGALAGFVLGRDGRVMNQIGPLAAEDHAVAQALLAKAIAATPGAIAIDIADRHVNLIAWLEHLGFAMERPLTRMIHKKRAAFDDAARLFAIAGPELG